MKKRLAATIGIVLFIHSLCFAQNLPSPDNALRQFETATAQLSTCGCEASNERTEEQLLMGEIGAVTFISSGVVAATSIAFEEAAKRAAAKKFWGVVAGGSSVCGLLGFIVMVGSLCTSARPTYDEELAENPFKLIEMIRTGGKEGRDKALFFMNRSPEITDSVLEYTHKINDYLETECSK